VLRVHLKISLGVAADWHDFQVVLPRMLYDSFCEGFPQTSAAIFFGHERRIYVQAAFVEVIFQVGIRSSAQPDEKFVAPALDFYGHIAQPMICSQALKKLILWRVWFQI
jgi:hypothetical protein